ncbi:MAG: hypothetical protein NTZ12_06180 [Candidatus Aminicenantes bacterium]|nr:hypothetical protein [Candidatus Aminicenantes bacterium]
MNEKRNCFFSWLSVLIILSVAFPTSVLSQDLNQKIKKLEQMMTQLEQRIEKLEGIILELQKGQAKPIMGSRDKWKDKANWRLLKKGMSKKEVEQILGTPPKIVANAYYGDIWLYPDLQGGNASFDKDGILTSWKEI